MSRCATLHALPANVSCAVLTSCRAPALVACCPSAHARPPQLTSEGVWLVRGVLVLQPEQQLVVAAKATRLEELVLRDADVEASAAAAAAATTTANAHVAASPAAAAVSAPAPTSTSAAAAAGRPAVLVTKQSYAAGGVLALERCRLELGRSRGVGLQVKGKGCSVAAARCAVSGSGQAAVLVTDAALSLSGCSLAGGEGLGLSCRDNGTAAAADCELRGFGGACAAVTAGGSLELSGCRFYGSSYGQGDAAIATNSDAPGGTSSSNSSSSNGGAVGGKVQQGGGCGVLAEGKGSALAARGCSMAGFAGQAAAVVSAGAGAVLEDCTVTSSLHAALVRPLCRRSGAVGARYSRECVNMAYGWVTGHAGQAGREPVRDTHDPLAAMRLASILSNRLCYACTGGHPRRSAPGAAL